MTKQSLDPFGYWPAQRSRIRGLGGEDPPDDPTYVFHTQYSDVEAGSNVVEIRFRRMRARIGMLAVRIFQLRPDGNPKVTERARTTALLPALGKAKGTIRLAFDALDDAQYAVLGHVVGECDARAGDVEIVVGRAVEDPAGSRGLFGRLKARRALAGASTEQASLAWPVSQGFTPAQLREIDVTQLPPSVAQADEMAQWETAYVLRVLDAYGRLEAGARGLGIAASSDPIAEGVRTAGCEAVSVILGEEESIEQAAARAFPEATQGSGFDFAWTRSDLGKGTTPDAAIALLDEIMRNVRPGGLIVLMLAQRQPDLDENGLNRIALEYAARAHFVAQVRHDRNVAGRPAVRPFGIVVRRSTDEVLS